MILTFVNASPVLLMEVMGFSRGDYAITMALTAGVSMVVSFSTPFALGLFKPRTLMLVSQGLFLTAGVTLSLAHTNTVTLFGLTLICAGFSVGFGVAMSERWGRFRCAPGGQFHARYRAGLRFITVDLAGGNTRYQRDEYADRDSDWL